MLAKAASTLRLDWVRRLILLALVALSAWLLVRLVLALMAPTSVWSPVDLPTQSAQSASASVATTYDFSTNPFAAGDAPDVPDAAAPLPESDVPETTLNLEITAIRAVVGDPEGGSAQIKTPDGSETRFYVRDMIQPNVELRGVLPDHILLIVNGQNQRLSLEEARADLNPRSGSAGSTGSGPRQLSTIQGISWESLRRNVDMRLIADPDPAKRGLRVSAKSPAVKLADYGLEDGDIIQTIAGISTTQGLTALRDIPRRITPGRPFQVTLTRDGQPLAVTIGGPS